MNGLCMLIQCAVMTYTAYTIQCTVIDSNNISFYLDTKHNNGNVFASRTTHRLASISDGGKHPWALCSGKQSLLVLLWSFCVDHCPNLPG